MREESDEGGETRRVKRGRVMRGESDEGESDEWGE